MPDPGRFKDVNDTLGHSRGDKLLQAIGNQLTSLMGKSDTVVGMRSDEEMLLLPEIAAMEDGEGDFLGMGSTLRQCLN